MQIEFSLSGAAAQLEVMSTEDRPLALADITRAVCSGGMTWDRLPFDGQGPFSSLPRNMLMVDPVGLFGLYEDVFVRLVYGHLLLDEATPDVLRASEKPVTPRLALSTLDQTQLARVPALAGAALTAATSVVYPAVSGPYALARLCERAPLLPASRPVPENVLQRALHFLEYGQRLWQPAARRALPHLRADNPVYLDLILLAAGCAEHDGLSEAETCGVALKFDREHLDSAWPTLLVYEANGMTAEQARYLFNGRLPPVLLDAAALADAPLPAEVLDLQRGIVTALLREAAEAAVYAPHGGFTLALPDGYPLREYGIEAWRVWAEPEGLWFLPICRGQVSAGYWWTPEMHRTTLVAGQATRLSALLEVTAAALWRDLCVAGETVIRPRNGSGRGLPRPPAALTAPVQPGRPAVRVLPARRIVLTGPREWGAAAEREVIARQAHGVRGHLRTLHAGWSASADARRIAEEFSIPVPDGYTFVRPHTRGEGESAGQPNVVVQARGLATVMTLVR